MPTPIDKQVYPELDEFFDDLGQAYRKAVRGFADAGCRYLQLDEVFIAMLCDPKYREQMTKRGDDPDKLGPLYADLINAAMSDIPADMTITMHLCRGNYKSTFMGAGGYDAEAEVLFDRIKVHGYFMEYDTERAGGFEPLRLVPKGKIVVLGLVTTKTGQLESKDDHQAPHRRGGEVRRARPALPVAAMRLRLDRGGQYADRGRAMGEAADDRRGGRRGVGRERYGPRHPPPSSPGLTRRSMMRAFWNSGKVSLERRVMDRRVKPGGDDRVHGAGTENNARHRRRQSRHRHRRRAAASAAPSPC